MKRKLKRFSWKKFHHFEVICMFSKINELPADLYLIFSMALNPLKFLN